MKRLLVYYYRNLKAQMNLIVFEKVFSELDSYFRVKSKKILLLINNTPSHFDSNYLPNKQDEDSANKKIEFTSTSSKFL